VVVTLLKYHFKTKIIYSTNFTVSVIKNNMFEISFQLLVDNLLASF